MKTFNVPVEGGAVEARPYTAVLIPVGGKRIKFAIQADAVLAHYASGYRIGNLNDIKIERMARISSYTRTTNREAAILTVARLVDRVGEARFLAKLDSVPVINP